MAERFQVGIDARRTTLWPQTGIARYTRNLLREIDALAPSDIEVSPIDIKGSARESPDTLWAGHGTPAPRRAVEEQVTMTRLSRHLDLLHLPWSEGPAWPRCPLVTTVFDLAIVDRPDAYNWAFRTYYTRLVELHVRRAARVIVSSQATLEAARRRWGNRPFRLIPLGVDAVYRGGSLDERAAEPTVLYTGGYDPRKRLGDLVRAIARVGRRIDDLRLVLTGEPPPALRRLLAEELGDRAVLTGFLSDEQLAAAYRQAWVVAYPTDDEGFGFPIVESFASGTPVIATRVGSIPEVAGDAAVLVDAGNADALEEALESLLLNDAERARLREGGLRRAEQYRWPTTVARTLDVYREVLT